MRFSYVKWFDLSAAESGFIARLRSSFLSVDHSHYGSFFYIFTLVLKPNCFKNPFHFIVFSSIRDSLLFSSGI